MLDLYTAVGGEYGAADLQQATYEGPDSTNPRDSGRKERKELIQITVDVTTSPSATK